jgi:hypothetical protein
MSSNSVVTSYEAPTIKELGSFEELTQSHNGGNYADQVLAQNETLHNHSS